MWDRDLDAQAGLEHRLPVYGEMWTEGSPARQRKRVRTCLVLLAVALEAGTIVFLRAHESAGARHDAARGGRIEAQPNHAGEKSEAEESGGEPSRPRAPGRVAASMRRVSAAAVPVSVLTSPPLPSRVLPGPWPGGNGPGLREPVLSSTTPPIPNKILPGPIR